MIQIPVFETERLILRAPEIGDMPAFADFMMSDRAKFVGGPGRVLFDSARSFGHMSGLWLLRGYSCHVICLKDGTAIGFGGPWFPYVWPEPELGWSLWHGAYEGQGYVTEAMTLLRDWARDGLKLPSLVSYIHPDNHASQAVAKRLGAVLDESAAAPEGPGPVQVYRHWGQL